MRHLGFIIIICGLLACLIAAWAHRFAPAAGATRVGIDALRLIGEKPSAMRQDADGMRITAGGAQPAAASFTIPGVGEPAHLVVRFHAVADGIKVGSDLWDDGRLFIEWMDGEEVAGISRIHSARGDEDNGVRKVVISSPVAGAVPVLRFQHLGAGGTFEIRFLEFIAARERRVWSLGKWLLAAGFLTTVAALAGGTKKPARWRGWVAASIWMLVAVHYVFPGPWDAARPFIVPFAFAEVPVFQIAKANSGVAAAVSGSYEVSQMERLPPPSDIGLRLKLWLPWLRPLLHLALLFTPVMAMAWFAGARHAFWLGWALSLLIEAAQTLYGFGFGWDDVWDLLVNGIAISAAVWAHRKFASRIHSLMPFPFPGPSGAGVEKPG